MVEVYMWLGFPGHIALKVDGGTPAGAMYLSRFPASNATKYMISLEGMNQNYQQDLNDYGQPHVVRLSRLDETAVKRAVIKANKIMAYNDFYANCATHVKFCLDSGVGIATLAAFTHGGLIGSAFGDTPPGVYAYAKGLHSLYG